MLTLQCFKKTSYSVRCSHPGMLCKRESAIQVFSVNFAKFFKTLFYLAHPEDYFCLFHQQNLLNQTTLILCYSNGGLDPWSGYGVLESDNPSIVTVFIKDGAHHLDLRTSNPLDPDTLIHARNIHKSNIRKWTEEYRKMKNLQY